MKEFLSTIEAAKFLGVSRITVFNRIKAGEIKAAKAGRNYIIHRDEIKRIMSPDFLSDEKKEEIDKGVDKVVKEYKETLRLLEDS